MKYSIGLLFLFLSYHKTIDALNPWWRLLIIPILYLAYAFEKQIEASLLALFQKKRTLLILKIIFFSLLSFRAGKSIYNTYRPLKAIEDIAVVHKQAVDLLFKRKENPYKHLLFEQAPIRIERNGKTDTYSGFIYTPLGIIYYAPFILWLGKKGMYAGNMLGYWGLFILTLVILARTSKEKMYLGGIFFLSIDYVFTKAFNRGTNDFLPALLMLLSLYFSQNQKKKAGLLLGLSLGFKQYPGAIMSFIYLLKKETKIILISCLIFSIILLPFAVNDLHYLYRQIFEVFLFAPIGNTILKDLPRNMSWMISLLAVAAMIYSTIKLKDKNDWSVVLIPFLIFIIFTKSSFTTYFICIFPISIFWFLNTPRYIKEK